MLSPKATFEALQSRGFDFFTGVPDSLLKDFCAYVTDHAPDGSHVIAANEGNAIALAMGHTLGTGKPALVYMQNSGIGNAVNPLMSLADPEIYGVPMLLMVGWRGAPGVKDEPQHKKQGRIMPALLDALELPWYEVGPDSDFDAVLLKACKALHEKCTPVVLLVRPDTFEAHKLKKDVRTEYPMNREQAIQRVVEVLDPRTAVISTTGKASRELYEYRAARGEGHGRDFLTVGGMGHTASIAMGLARACPERPVVCLDGDGSVLMHLGALAVIGQSPLRNLVHVVINNGAHDSVGGQPTVGFEVDLTAIARACGYRECVSVTAPDEVTREIQRLQGVEGPTLLEIRVNKGGRADLGRPKTSPTENRIALMDFVGSSLSPKLSSQHLLRTMLDGFDALGLRVWMDQGSLLGLIRSGKLIPGDHDIDLGCWREDLARVRDRVIAFARDRGLWVTTRSAAGMVFRCGIHPNCFQLSLAVYDDLNGVATKRVPCPPKQLEPWRWKTFLVCDGLVKLADIPDQHLDPSVTTHRWIAMLRRFTPAVVRELGARVAAPVLREVRRYVVMKAPASYFKELDPVEIDGVRFFVPSHPESYLEFKYGSDWRTPRRDWVYWEEDGGLARA